MKTEENITAAARLDERVTAEAADDAAADDAAAATADAAPYPDDHPWSEKNLGYKVMPPEHWRTPPPKYDGTGPAVYTWTYTRGYVRVWPR